MYSTSADLKVRSLGAVRSHRVLALDDAVRLFYKGGFDSPGVASTSR